MSATATTPATAGGLLQLGSVLFMLLVAAAATHEFPRDGSIIELDESNFDAAIAAFDFLLVDFYAPWCGHCKSLAPELDAAAPVLAALKEPIYIAKLDADKFRKFNDKYEIDGFPTMKIFMHGIPLEYSGPRKADLLVRFLKKFVKPDFSLLESDSAIYSFIGEAGTNFPIFIGFGLDGSLIIDLARKYKKKAWFAVAKGFSEDIMVVYDFDKVPALVSIHPKYGEHNVFYGPFEGDFLEDFIQQHQLPLTVPVNSETLKLMNDDGRKIVLTVVEDESDERSLKLVKVLRSAANANRGLMFGYVGVKQWEEFADTFDATESSKLPKIMVWDRNEYYHIVEGLESIQNDDQATQISRFLEGYKEGRTIKKTVKGASFMGYVNSLISIKTVYIIIVFIMSLLMIIRIFFNQNTEAPHAREDQNDAGVSGTTEGPGNYQPGNKVD